MGAILSNTCPVKVEGSMPGLGSMALLRSLVVGQEVSRATLSGAWRTSRVLWDYTLGDRNEVPGTKLGSMLP